MRPDRSLPAGLSMSLGDESVPITMDAEIGHMTMDQAIASGLFDVPDAPGMVSIPVTLQVAIPNHLLQPPALPPGPVADHGGTIVPAGGRRPRMRFGNYPRAVAARNIAKAIGNTLGPSRAADDASFREMLNAIRPSRTLAAPSTPAIGIDRAGQTPPAPSFPALPPAPPIDPTNVTARGIVADAPPARPAPMVFQAPTPVDGNGRDKPGPVASWFRSTFGDVDPDQWATTGAETDGAAGAAMGVVGGGAAGLVAGGAAGSLVNPGAGTFGGAVAGADAGAVEGALAGGAAGAAALGGAGKLAGEFVNYMEGKGKHGGSRGTQSKQPPEKPAIKSREGRVSSTQHKIDSLKEHLDERHLDAVRQEQKGEVVKINPLDGEPFDHVDEVQSAPRGLLKEILRIKNRLGYPELDPAERAAWMEKLGQASRLLDHTRNSTKGAP